MATRKKTGLRKRRKPYRRTRANAKLHYEGAHLISIPESMRLTGLGLSLSYRMAREGKLPGALQLDGRWFVHKAKLLEWLEKLGNAA